MCHVLLFTSSLCPFPPFFPIHLSTSPRLFKPVCYVFLCQFVSSVFPASVLCLLCSSCSRLCPQCFCSTLLLFLLCIFVDLYSRICLRAPSACQCLDWKLPLLPLWLLFNESMDSTCSPVPFPTLYQICFWLNVAFFLARMVQNLSGRRCFTITTTCVSTVWSLSLFEWQTAPCGMECISSCTSAISYSLCAVFECSFLAKKQVTPGFWCC